MAVGAPRARAVLASTPARPAASSSCSSRRCSGPRPPASWPLSPHTTHLRSGVPHTEDGPWLEQTALQLLDEHRALGRRPLAAHHALRRSLLEALLLRLAHSPGVSDPPDAGTNFHGNSPNSASPPGTGARLPVYEQFLDALELHFRELYRADDYAQLLGCSVRTISRAARAATGKGAREIINERRLLEARRLLGHTQWTAHTVAAHLGFTDAANFGRFFRHHTGIAPAAYMTRQTIPEP